MKEIFKLWGCRHDNSGKLSNYYSYGTYLQVIAINYGIEITVLYTRYVFGP